MRKREEPVLPELGAIFFIADAGGSWDPDARLRQQRTKAPENDRYRTSPEGRGLSLPTLHRSAIPVSRLAAYAGEPLRAPLRSEPPYEQFYSPTRTDISLKTKRSVEQNGIWHCHFGLELQ